MDEERRLEFERVGRLRTPSQLLPEISRMENPAPPVPPPPFKASKRVAEIMYALWYGRITVEEAHELGRKYGFSAESMKTMVEDATAPPSYWSRSSDSVRKVGQTGQ